MLHKMFLDTGDCYRPMRYWIDDSDAPIELVDFMEYRAFLPFHIADCIEYGDKYHWGP